MSWVLTMNDAKWVHLARAASQDGSGCPEDEALRLWIDGQPSQVVTEHVACCPRCRLEADEMRAFFSPIDDNEIENNATVRHVRARLDAVLGAPSLPNSSASTTPVSLTWWRAVPVPTRPWLAAAAVVVLAVGLAALLPGWRDTAAPALPSMGGGVGPFRGVAIATALVPQGRVSTVPGSFQWAPSRENPTLAGAEAWEFRLESVDGTALWSTVTVEARVQLPVDVMARLTPGNRYIWKILRAGDGQSSATASFFIEPGR